MSSKLIYEVCGSAGTYKAQDGSEKTRWIKAGVVFKNDKGYVSLKLDSIPTRRNEQGELWLSLFVPQAKDEQKKPEQQGFREDKPDLSKTDGDDIPF
jgi:hypothetical protein